MGQRREAEKFRTAADPDRPAAQQEKRAHRCRVAGRFRAPIGRHGRPVRTGRASSTAAASDDPPPRPAPIGMRLVEPASRRGLAFPRFQPGAARATRLSAICELLRAQRRFVRARVKAISIRVGQRDSLKNRTQFVETVGAFRDHAQIEIDFGQGAHARTARCSFVVLQERKYVVTRRVLRGR